MEIFGDFGDREPDHVAKDLTKILKPHGYSLSTIKNKHLIRWKDFRLALPLAAGLVTLFVFLQKSGWVNLSVSSELNYGAAFVIGLVASVSTCMAVVGGLTLSLSANFAKQGDKIRPQIFLHLGRFFSFLVLGGVIGSLGSVFQLKTSSFLVLNIFIAIILFVLGFNLLDIFPWAKKLQLTVPGFIGRRALNLKNINYSLLKNYASPVTPPDISTLANQFQMVWLDHGDWRTRLMRPSDGIPENYYYTQYFASAALLLHLNYTLEQKKKLLINFMQLGIDLYSFLESGSQGWAPDGGNMNERKWPIMFAGIMLNYAPMKNIGFKSGDYLYANGHGPGNPPSDFVYFGEDGQTFYVAQSDIDITNSSSWHPDTRTAPNYPYTKAMLGMPEWGIRYSTSPSLSDASWNANYRTIGTGVSTWAGTSIAVRMMSAKTLWNHNSYFDYIDRYMAISKGDRDPFGYVVPGEKAGARATGFIGAMYDTYRNQF